MMKLMHPIGVQSLAVPRCIVRIGPSGRSDTIEAKRRARVLRRDLQIHVTQDDRTTRGDCTEGP